MKYSQQFKSKLNVCKISYIIITIIIIYILVKYIIKDLIPYLKMEIIILISIFLIISILIITIDYIKKLNKLEKLGKEKIYKELDNYTQKVFKEFGLYITKDYIVCIGSKLSILNLFVVPIKSIDTIDTGHDSRYFYKKRGKESKHKFLSFIISSIKENIYFNNNNSCVFNIICDKNIYCITTASVLNKRKVKKINEAADYICEKYKNIDYI